MKPSEQFNRLIGNSLEFLFLDGNVTPIPFPHETPWRSMPWTVFAQLLDGEGIVEFRDTGEALQVECGDCFVASHREHRFLLTSSQQAVSRWVHCEFRVLETIDFLGLFTVPGVISAPTSQQIGDICEELELSKSGAGDRSVFLHLIRRKELGYKLLTMVTENSCIKTNALDILLKTERLGPVLAFIEKNLASDITPEILAGTMNLSVPRFYTMFKQFMDCAPLEYVYRQRLRKSQQLLATTDMQLAEITEVIGFKDPFHFSKRFKKLFGVSPSVYRQQCKIE